MNFRGAVDTRAVGPLDTRGRLSSLPQAAMPPHEPRLHRAVHLSPQHRDERVSVLQRAAQLVAQHATWGHG